jgi:hypothetical protein
MLNKKAGIKNIKKAGILCAAFAMAGCAQTKAMMDRYEGTKETNTIIGAGVGYAVGAAIGGDIAPLVGVVIGGATGYGMSDPCEGKTTTVINRSVGQQNGAWQGTQRHTETCRNGGQPGNHNLPDYTNQGSSRGPTQNNSASNNFNGTTWEGPAANLQYLYDKDIDTSYVVIDQTRASSGMVYPVVAGENNKTCIAAMSPHGGYNYYQVYRDNKTYKNTNNVPMASCK